MKDRRRPVCGIFDGLIHFHVDYQLPNFLYIYFPSLHRRSNSIPFSNPLLFLRVVIIGHLIWRAVSLFFQMACRHYRAVSLKLELQSLQPPGGLLIAKPHTHGFWFSKSGVVPQKLLFYGFPSDVDAAGLETHFEDHCCRKLFYKHDAILRKYVFSDSKVIVVIRIFSFLPGMSSIETERFSFYFVFFF